MARDHGGAFYDDPSVHESYVAQRTADRFDPKHVMEDPAFVAELGDPTGLRVLDIGCGDGRFGARLIEAGCASYRGVDGSWRMIQLARQALEGTAATLAFEAIEDLRIVPNSVDLITARLSLHYVRDLDAVLAVSVIGLVPGGRLLFSVVHPVITSCDDPSDAPRTSWTVDDYFVEGPRERAWMGSSVSWHHRTLETYVDALTRAGLRVGGCTRMPTRRGPFRR